MCGLLSDVKNTGSGGPDRNVTKSNFFGTLTHDRNTGRSMRNIDLGVMFPQKNETAYSY